MQGNDCHVDTSKGQRGEDDKKGCLCIKAFADLKEKIYQSVCIIVHHDGQCSDERERMLALEFWALAFYGLACWQTPDIE